MPCPIRDRCIWYQSMPEDSIFRTDCEEGENYRDCVVYETCKDAPDVYACTKCLFETPTSQLDDPASLDKCKGER